jgi:hypothetical protein
MGEVYKARDTRLDGTVATKTSKTEFSERFAREARAVAALNHPNICQLCDLGTLPDGGSYLVMEFVDAARRICGRGVHRRRIHEPASPRTVSHAGGIGGGEPLRRPFARAGRRSSARSAPLRRHPNPLANNPLVTRREDLCAETCL